MVFSYAPAMACSPPAKSPPEMAPVMAATATPGGVAFNRVVVLVGESSRGGDLLDGNKGELLRWLASGTTGRTGLLVLLATKKEEGNREEGANAVTPDHKRTEIVIASRVVGCLMASEVKVGWVGR